MFLFRTRAWALGSPPPCLASASCSWSSACCRRRGTCALASYAPAKIQVPSLGRAPLAAAAAFPARPSSEPGALCRSGCYRRQPHCLAAGAARQGYDDDEAWRRHDECAWVLLPALLGTACDGQLCEHAESIAFYNGAPREAATAVGRLASLILTARQRVAWAGGLSLVSNYYSYITIIMPSLLTAPRYFAGEVEFGVITQVPDALSALP